MSTLSRLVQTCTDLFHNFYLAPSMDHCMGKQAEGLESSRGLWASPAKYHRKKETQWGALQKGHKRSSWRHRCTTLTCKLITKRQNNDGNDTKCLQRNTKQPEKDTQWLYKEIAMTMKTHKTTTKRHKTDTKRHNIIAKEPKQPQKHKTTTRDTNWLQRDTGWLRKDTQWLQIDTKQQQRHKITTKRPNRHRDKISIQWDAQWLQRHKTEPPITVKHKTASDNCTKKK